MIFRLNYNGKRTICLILTVFLILALITTIQKPIMAVAASGRIYYVNAAAGGANDGSAWSNAFTDLQSALTLASAGDQIWVAKGTYKPTSTSDNSISFVPHLRTDSIHF